MFFQWKFCKSIEALNCFVNFAFPSYKRFILLDSRLIVRIVDISIRINSSSSFSNMELFKSSYFIHSRDIHQIDCLIVCRCQHLPQYLCKRWRHEFVCINMKNSSSITLCVCKVSLCSKVSIKFSEVDIVCKFLTN